MSTPTRMRGTPFAYARTSSPSVAELRSHIVLPIAVIRVVPAVPGKRSSTSSRSVAAGSSMAGLERPEAHRDLFVLARPCSGSDDT